MLTVRQMRYFDALATARHFGKAADAVHVSQPALSAQIMEMESHLGVKLVERNRTGILLSAKGQEILPKIRSILADIDSLEQQARSGGNILDGLVRIGIIPTVAPYLVPVLIPHLRNLYPAIRVELREAVTGRLLGDLADGRLDAMVAAMPVDTAAGLESHFLFQDRFFMAMAKNNTDVLISPLPEAEVDRERLLLLEEGHCLRDQALAVCGMAGKRNPVNYGATSMATLLQMVTHDMGMTLIPEIAVAAETARNNLRIVPFAEPQPARQIGLFWRRHGGRERDMQALAEAIRTCAPVGNPHTGQHAG